MGIDAASVKTGYSIFNDLKLVDYGLIQTHSNYPERLLEQSQALGQILDKYKPDIVYVEDVPNNPRGGIKTAIILGAVQGMVFGVVASRNIDIKFILPSVWRSPMGLFDGTKTGKLRDELKYKSVLKANELFGLDLVYKSPNSKYNCDDISDAILLCYSQIKPRTFGGKLDKSN